MSSDEDYVPDSQSESSTENFQGKFLLRVPLHLFFFRLDSICDYYNQFYDRY